MSKPQTSLAGGVEIPVVHGICTGRNGTVDIKALSVGGYNDWVRIDCVSRSKGIILNAGFAMDRKAAKKLSKALKTYLKQT